MLLLASKTLLLLGQMVPQDESKNKAVSYCNGVMFRLSQPEGAVGTGRTVGITGKKEKER